MQKVVRIRAQQREREREGQRNAVGQGTEFLENVEDPQPPKR